MKWIWGQDDLRLIGDAVALSALLPLLRLATRLAGQGIKLIALKAFLEPLAAQTGQQGWQRVNRLLGGRLPQWPLRESPAAVDSDESSDCRISRH